jgi:hypothetical protein
MIAPMSGHEQCAQCGFDGARYDASALLDAIRALGPRWRGLLADAGDDLRTRPEPEVWSALEYAAHSRDITALHVFGVELALTGEEPTLPEIASDDLIESAAAGYPTEDPGAVVDAIAAHATRLAGAAATAGDETWTRGLTIGAERSEVRWLLEHALHDSVHHLDDVERGLAHLRRSR